MGMAGKSLAKDGKALKAVSQGNVNVKPAAVSNSTADNSKTFYTVQNSMEAKRLLGDGTPWPTDGDRANLGDGVYAWGNIDDANRYLTIRQGRISEPLSILKFEVYDSDLVNMRKFDTRVLTDDELNDFFDKYARLHDGKPNHGFDYIINDTNLGVEHYFNKTIFEKLHFLGKEGV